MRQGIGATPEDRAWSLKDYWNGITSTFSRISASCRAALYGEQNDFEGYQLLEEGQTGSRAPASNETGLSVPRCAAPSFATLRQQINAPNMTGIVFASIAGASYFFNGAYSAVKTNGPDSVGFNYYLASSSALVNAILFFITGKNAYKNWSKLLQNRSENKRAIITRLGLAGASILPSFILLSSIRRSTTEGAPIVLPSAVSWMLAGSMMGLRVVLNAQALEGLDLREYNSNDSRPNKILVAAILDHQKSQSSCAKYGTLIKLGIITSLALSYTYFEHARTTEALDYMSENNYSAIMPLTVQYTIEALACLLLAPLNVTWALAGVTTNSQISMRNFPLIFAIMLRGMLGAIDICINSIISGISRDESHIKAALNRSGKNIIHATATALILSSCYSAVALTISSPSSSTPGQTVPAWEASQAAQYIAVAISAIMGTEMNCSSTWLQLDGERADLYYSPAADSAPAATEAGEPAAAEPATVQVPQGIELPPTTVPPAQQRPSSVSSTGQHRHVLTEATVGLEDEVSRDSVSTPGTRDGSALTLFRVASHNVLAPPLLLDKEPNPRQPAIN